MRLKLLSNAETGPRPRLREPIDLTRSVVALAVSVSLTACGFAGCEKYASSYSCSYVETEAEYEVWYWRDLGRDNEEDNRLVGRAVGLEMCRANAMLYAETIGENWNDRAYICMLMEDGRRMEKHRLMPA